MKEKNQEMTYEEVLENIKMRDENDRHKEIGSLMIAEDAIVIDTTNMEIEEVTQTIANLILKARENN